MPEVGRFVLEQRLGSGGMAEVFRARPTGGRAPLPRVALKLVAADVVHSEEARTAFRNEVRAMARLTHPAIAAVYDYGVVSAREEERSAGALRQGSPWLSMELAEGTASSLAGRIEWPVQRRLLAALLAALGHAHARGVLHRDLKPSNVLLFRDGAFKLSDFGVAAIRGVDAECPDELWGHAVAGTPSYMAPEQARARRQDFGPPTDLYALGCFAYALACGDPPFGRSADARAMAAAHENTRPPPLFARMPVPAGLEPWIERLLAKDPRDRYQRAADAAADLDALDGGRDAAPRASSPASPARRTADSLTVDETTEWKPASLSHAPATELDAAPAVAAPRSERDPAFAARLALAGLGLHWLRGRPLVGRQAEQARLLALLAEVRALGRPRLVILSGEAGRGASALARWLCEHADEQGAAVVLSAVHEPMAGRHHGIEAMLARFLRTPGLAPAERRVHVGRIAERLGPPPADAAELEALADLAGAPDEDAPRVGAASERYALVARLLGRVGAAQPPRAVIVWLDDAHWGADSLALARYCLDAEHGARAPLLLVVTVRDDLLGERPAEQRLLAALRLEPRTAVIELGPLAAPAQYDLLAQLAPLDSSTAALVAAHTAASPLFAVQLVGDWIDGDALDAGEDGTWRTSARAELHADVRAIWMRRVERALAGEPAEEAVALEVAATLGQHVDAVEWGEACAAAGVAAPARLVDRLLAHGLATPGARGPRWSWSFAHGMVRETIAARAAAAGRGRLHHLACAAMLAGRPGPAAIERRARHLLAGGDPGGAADPLLFAGARTRAESGDFALAEALLLEREAALRDAGCPHDDPRWGAGWLLRGRLLLRSGRHADAAHWAREAERAAGAHRWEDVRARAELLLAELGRSAGALVEAERRVTDAEERARQLGDERLLGECLLERGAVLMDRGDFAGADAICRRAGVLLAGAGEHAAAATAAVATARAAWAAGHYDESLEQARSARQAAYDAGDRYGVARCLLVMGDAMRLKGDITGAEQYYRRALKRFEPLGAAVAVATARAKLGLAALEAGRTPAAREKLERSLAELRTPGLRLAWVHAALAAACADAGDWPAVDEHLDAAGGAGGEPTAADVDVARLAERCSESCARAGEAGRAERAAQLAAAQWTAVGRPEGAATLRSPARR